ncbi:GtrA family protein [Georgenia phoenicis]|uniref:GtrA family protein n=1 Tax=unclassified Georgenia TaxID=2626815 RepID=UPI0039AE97D8
MTSSHTAAELPTGSDGDREAVGARAAAGARWLRWRQRALEMLRFGAVGGVAFVVDVGLMNLLRFGPGEVLGDKPLTAKVLSVVVATLVSWLGNRYWAFAASRREERGRELAWFLLVNAGGMLIAVGTLGVSHYVLGFTSPLADNIAANGVGLALGTLFRYFCYRHVVFTAR